MTTKKTGKPAARKPTTSAPVQKSRASAAKPPARTAPKAAAKPVSKAVEAPANAKSASAPKTNSKHAPKSAPAVNPKAPASAKSSAHGEPHAEPVAAPKSKLTKDELKQLKGTLLEIREKLTRQIGSMEGEALGEAGSEVSVDHMADHGTDTFDQDFTLGLIENEENTIREIDAALERMNEGTYGMCEPCVEQMAKLCKTCPHIPKARLEAIPYTRYCVEYAKIAERDREIEEAQEEEEE